MAGWDWTSVLTILQGNKSSDFHGEVWHWLWVFLQMPFVRLRNFPSFPSLLSVVIMKRSWVCQRLLSVCVETVNCWDCICPRTSFVQLLVPYKDENGNWAHKLLLFLNRYAYVWKPKVLSLLSFQKTTKVQYKPTNFQIASRLTDEILSCGPGSFSSLQGVESGQRIELGKWTILKCTMTITLGILEHVGWSLTLSKLENKKKKSTLSQAYEFRDGCEKEKVWVNISHAIWIGSLKNHKIVLD